MKIKENIFDTLRILARDESTHPRIFLSAAIVKNNRIISVGVNRMDKTDSFQRKYGRNKDSIYPHAEIMAIKNSLKIIDIDELKKCNIYVCRVKYDGTDKKNIIDGIAKPCKGCMRAIITFGIKNIFYTTDENRIYGII